MRLYLLIKNIDFHFWIQELLTVADPDRSKVTVVPNENKAKEIRETCDFYAFPP